MTSKKRDSSDANAAFERSVFAALLRDGGCLPTTASEVERAEAMVISEEIDTLTPSSLQEALKRGRQYLSAKLEKDLQYELLLYEQDLSRAAREGNDIPEEVEARMRADRKEAEKNRGE